MKRSFYLCFLSVFVIFGLLIGGCTSDDKSNTPEGETAGFTISPTSNYSPKADFGYTTAPFRTVTVTNTGSSALTVNIALSGTNAASFTLNKTTLELATKDDKDTFTVSPNTGLGVNTYTAKVTVSAAGLESKSFNVSFTVEVAGPYEPDGPETHVFIAFGQSNMQGPGEAQAQDQNDVPERFQTLNVVAATYAYGNTVVPNVTPNNGRREKGQWYKAVPPNIIEGSNPTGSTGTKVGLSPMDYFGRTVVANTHEDITIGVVAVANGDLALSSFRKEKGAVYFDNSTTGKESGRPSGTERQGWTRYTATAGYESMYDAIVTNAKIAQNEGGIIKGIILHQGESGRGLTDKTWVDILKEIYDDLLEDLELEPDSIPIICGQPYGGSGATSTGNNGPDGMLNPDLRIQQTIPNAWIVDSIGLQDRNDKIHFSTQGIRDLGARYAQKMLELVYNTEITLE